MPGKASGPFRAVLAHEVEELRSLPKVDWEGKATPKTGAHRHPMRRRTDIE